MKEILKEERTYSKFIVCIFLAIFFVRMLTKIPMKYSNTIICIVGITAFLISYFKFNLVRKNSVFIVIFVAWSFVSMSITGNTNLGEIGLIIAFQGIAFVLITNKGSLKYLHIFTYFVYLFLIIQILIRINPNQILNEASHNFISVLAIMLFVMDSVYRLEQEKKPSLFLLLCCLFLCIMATGRGGIVSVLALTIGIVYLNIIQTKPTIVKLIFFTVTLILMVLGYYIYNEKIVYYYGMISYDAPRFYLWNLYIKDTISETKNILFGTPFYTEEVFVAFLKNLHNIFFNLHGKYGIVPLIIVVYMNVKCIIRYYRLKNYYYLLFIFIILFRSLTDFTSFPGVFDIAWFYLVYNCMEKSLVYRK